MVCHDIHCKMSPCSPNKANISWSSLDVGAQSTSDKSVLPAQWRLNIFSDDSIVWSYEATTWSPGVTSTIAGEAQGLRSSSRCLGWR